MDTQLAPSELLAKPALTVEELFVGLLGLPASTGEHLLREPDPPHVFLLGRRRYVLTADALEWLERRAGRPYGRRRNQKR